MKKNTTKYNVYSAWKNSENKIIVDGENGYCDYSDTITIEHAKLLYRNGIFKTKQITVRNSDIKRIKDKNGNLYFDFDFSILWNKEKRTYDGLSYKDYILYSITVHNPDDKMSGFKSISGVPFNCYCDKKALNPEFICHDCYSRKQLKRYIDLHFKCAKNEFFYNNVELTIDDIPYINDCYFRFESFGELTTPEKVKNYFLICEKNKNCFFAFFTKLPFIVDTAFKKYGLEKPDNCKFILSSPLKNIKAIVPDAYKYFIDATFTVFTKQYVKEHNIVINCLKKCIHCLKCYGKNGITELFEIEK